MSAPVPVTTAEATCVMGWYGGVSPMVCGAPAIALAPTRCADCGLTSAVPFCEACLATWQKGERRCRTCNGDGIKGEPIAIGRAA